MAIAEENALSAKGNTDASPRMAQPFVPLVRTARVTTDL
jgi:hypothetical protein